jgi:hypothetical protein
VESVHTTLLELEIPQVQANPNQRSEDRWKDPADDITKLNIDGALNKPLSDFEWRG